MRTTAPPAGGSGSGNSSILRFSGPPIWCKRTARTVRVSGLEDGCPDQAGGDFDAAHRVEAAARSIERKETADREPHGPGAQESPVGAESDAGGDRVARDVAGGELREGRLEERSDRGGVEDRLGARGEERHWSRDAGGPRRLPVAGPDGPPGRRTDDRDLVGQAIARPEARGGAAHLAVAGGLKIGGLQTKRERRRLRQSSQESDPEDHGVALPRAPGLRSD